MADSILTYLAAGEGTRIRLDAVGFKLNGSELPPGEIQIGCGDRLSWREMEIRALSISERARSEGQEILLALGEPAAL